MPLLALYLSLLVIAATCCFYLIVGRGTHKLRQLLPGYNSTGTQLWRSASYEAFNWWEVPVLEPIMAAGVEAPEGGSSCSHCGAGGNLSKCGACKVAAYCSRDCQRAAWTRGHKAECEQLKRKAAAAAAHSSSAKKEPERDEVAPLPDQVLYPYDRFLTHFTTQLPPRPPTGLTNCGNTCFSNALLQCLLHTAPLIGFLRSGDHASGCSKPPDGICLLCELQALATQCDQAGAGAAVNPRRIVRNVKKFSPLLTPGHQEDAHELLLGMMTHMEGALLHGHGGKDVYPDLRTRETTFLGHAFGSYAKWRTVCPECGHASQSFNTLMDIPLEVSARTPDIDSCFRALFMDEQLDDDNLYKCDQCKEKVQATRGCRLEVAPNILILYLKRFRPGHFGKVNRFVKYPEVLDLQEHMAEGALDTLPVTYSLYGVVVHLDSGGSTMWGHYIAYVKGPDGRWFCCDDERITEVPASTALSQCAYLLFYQRQQPHAPPDPPLKQRLLKEQDAKIQAAAAAAAGQAGMNGGCHASLSPAAVHVPNGHGPPGYSGLPTSNGCSAYEHGHQLHGNGISAHGEASAAGNGREVEGRQGDGSIIGKDLPSPAWRIRLESENGRAGGEANPDSSSGDGPAVVLYVDLPGVTSPNEVQLSVQGLNVSVLVPGMWHLAITVPDGLLRRQQVDGQRSRPVELQAGKVVFRIKSSQLRVQLQVVTQPAADQEAELL